MARGSILDDAKEIINGGRVDSYGKPEDNFKLIAQLWTTYTGTFINEHDVAMMMCLLKIARAKTGIGTRDSYIDLAGYCALAYDIKESAHGM